MQVLNIPQLGIDEERFSYLFAALCQHVEGQQMPFNPKAYVEGVPLTNLEAFALGAVFASSLYELSNQIHSQSNRLTNPPVGG